MILNTPFATLRRLATPQNETASNETCDFCSVGLSSRHRHLLEVSNHKIICACDACALRFENVSGGRFKLIPREGRTLENFRMDDAEWANLALPIDLAFIFQNSSTGGPTAIYPSPMGATESLITLEYWKTIVAQNPDLEELKPDVEALLINRTGQMRDYFIAPIDVCFELVGIIRKHWRGLSGGEKVRREIGAFFEQLRGQNHRTRRSFNKEAYA